MAIMLQQLLKYSLCLWLIVQITLSLDNMDVAMGEFGNVRIINAVHATRFSYMASIHLTINDTPIEICTGAVIHRLYVLTSSTCVFEVEQKDRNYKGFIRVGTMKLSANGTTYQFNAVFQHPLYDNIQRRHDIALVHMTTPIEFNTYVQPIDVSLKYLRGGKRVYTAGWGPYDVHTSGFSEDLRWVADESTNVFQCVDKIRFTGQSVQQLHWDETLCIKNLPRGGMCRADYGAPLIFNRTLVGVFSWGPENCTTENKFPYVFTRTSFYGKWINKYLNPK